jgi:hypothetical protein
MDTIDCQAFDSRIVALDHGTDDRIGMLAAEASPESGCVRGLFYGLVFVLPFWVTVIAVWLH